MIEIVYSFKTRYKEGFTNEEIVEILKMFPNLDLRKFYDTLYGITCMFKGNDIITCHSDILKALVCGAEKRGLRPREWD